MVPHKDGVSTAEASIIAVDLAGYTLPHKLSRTLLYNANKLMP
jgi:hypothetical protein